MSNQSLFPDIYVDETSGENEKARRRMAEKRAADRDITIPPVEDQVRRDACEHDLERFCRTYFAHLFYLEFSDLHRKLIRYLQDTILYSGRMAIAIPRGYGKTTLTLVAIVWAIVYGHRRYIVLICATKEESHERLDQIKEFFEDDETYADFSGDFPEACVPAQALQGATQKANLQTVAGKRTRLVWRDRRVRFATLADSPCSGTLVTVRSTDAAIRGLVRGDLRPDLVLGDDPQTDESARSAVQTASRDQVLTKGVEGLVGPGRALAVITLWTVIEKGDLADQYTGDIKPAYRSIREKALTTMPKNEALVEEYIARRRECQKSRDYKARAAHAWYIRHQGDIEAGASAAWQQNYVTEDVGDDGMAAALQTDDLTWASRHAPDLLRQEDVSAIQHCLNFAADNGWAVFQSELQNDPEDPFAEEIQQLDAHTISGRLTRLDRGVVPVDCDRVVVFIDCGGYQKGKGLHWGAAAFGRAFNGAIIDYGRRSVDKTVHGIEADLRQALDKLAHDLAPRKWPRQDGAAIRTALIMIDAHWQAETVYQFVTENQYAQILLPSMGFGLKPGRNLYTSVPKGASAGDGWIVDKPRNSAAQCLLCRFDANRRKTFAADRLLTPMGGQGRLAIFGRRADEHRAFAAQVASETRMRLQSDQGLVFDIWSEAIENHYWDVVVGLCTGAAVTGLRMEDPAATPRKRRPAQRRKKRKAKVYSL